MARWTEENKKEKITIAFCHILVYYYGMTTTLKVLLAMTLISLVMDVYFTVVFVIMWLAWYYLYEGKHYSE